MDRHIDQHSDRPLEVQPIRLAYIAGPFRASTPLGVRRNVEAARDLGLHVAEAGLYPIIPHMLTQEFDKLLTDQFWLDGTMALLDRCDVIVLTEHWARSKGASAERLRALELGMPAFVWEPHGMVPPREALAKFVEYLDQRPRRMRWSGFHKAGCPRLADCTCNQIAPSVERP